MYDGCKCKKHKAIKLLEKQRRKSLTSRFRQDLTLKALFIKGKINTLDFIKILKFRSAKDPVEQMKR